MSGQNVTNEKIIFHKHHILPIRLGGTNDRKNIIKVNIPLHAFLHKLLWEEHGDIKDKVAWLTLKGQITKAEAQLILVSQPKSEETKRKISESRKGIPSPWKGKTPSKETREKMRLAKLGKKQTKEHINKIIETKKEKYGTVPGSFQKGNIPWNKKGIL